MDERGYYPQHPNDEKGLAQTTIDLERGKVVIFKLKISNVLIYRCKLSSTVCNKIICAFMFTQLYVCVCVYPL